jgi:hypothetical protein
MNRNLDTTILRSFHMLHFEQDQIKRNPKNKKIDEQVGTCIYVANADSVRNLILLLFGQ